MKNLQKDQHVYFRGEKRKEEEKKLVCFVSRISSPRKFLLSGQSNDGLYVLSESSVMPIPQAFWSLCLSATVDLWHRCLGHPSPSILNLLVSNNKIACTSRCFLAHCQAYPLGKSSCLSL
jgi:hypothetical protein